MKYDITLLMSRYMKVGEVYDTIDTSRTFTFDDWDDVQNLIAYLVHGATGSVKFEVEAIKEEAEA